MFFFRSIYWTLGVATLSSMPAQSHTLVEIEHEIISTVSLLLPLIQEELLFKLQAKVYMHKILVNRLVKLAQEKSVARRTDCLDMTIAVDLDVKPQTNKRVKITLK